MERAIDKPYAGFMMNVGLLTLFILGVGMLTKSHLLALARKIPVGALLGR